MADEEKKKICFVIGPIGSAGSQTRINADFLLDGIIREVLEKEPFNYKVKRADKDVSPGSINSAVINDIIKADLAIADLSERNPNAFYELGIRHAFNKPVIHMIREGDAIPFDNFDQRCISFSIGRWEGIQTARENLKACVEHVLSPDYKPSNPVGMATALQNMVDSGNETGALVGALVERVNGLEKKINGKTNEIEITVQEQNKRDPISLQDLIYSVYEHKINNKTSDSVKESYDSASKAIIDYWRKNPS